ncbi:hypothetical protein E1193_19925 [Micromonospora sp. KC606]|uniref:hypothetical protein n=1 Tax=Micromonospora sp. KC606 TaxID=2530379 RepID=UPI001052D8F2|nr:hypothetical protein [Micromonospora sp. KC606]TDC78939.1 hypothetical protein E1193_19925 [Micromonospora sp. KC606]
MATFLRRKATAVTLGVLALTLAGGGIAAAQPTTKASTEVAQPGARSSGATQPPVSAADAKRARAALDAVGAQATAAGTVAWAVASSGGSLLRGSPEAVSVTRYGPGQYQVLFNYDVSRKAFQATIGTTDQYNIPPAGEISVAPRLSTINGVFVQTRDSAGTPADRPFHLLVAN